MVMRMGGLVETALVDAAEALDTRDDLTRPQRVIGRAMRAVDALEDFRSTPPAAQLLIAAVPGCG
jgi:phosphate transport system protein